MPKQKSDDSDYDQSEENNKFIYKKPQVRRLDKFKNLKQIVINLSTTQYPVVTDVAEDLGWKVQYDMQAGDWDVYWTDIPIDTDTLIKLHLFQKINYYPGIHTLARKNLLGMNLMNMKQRFPNDYNYFPLTWMLPQQYAQFRQYYQTKKQGKTRTYIIKPEAECQGRGIFLTRNIQDLQNGKHYVVQRYITKPYLMQGLKFDLRIYVLLCGTNPLRLYIYEDGLARFATQKYVEPTNQNLQQQFMHLTNYAINKRSPKFVFNNSSTNMGIGHKRSLKCIYEQMKKKGLNIDRLKIKINDLIIKTIIAGLPLMAHQYKCCQPEDYSNSMCFHVIGFDVMLDHREEPQLIEINHTPSFATDTPLDYKIKFALIKDTFKLMRITSKRKKTLFQMAKQSNQARLQNKKRLILDGPDRLAKIAEQQKIRDIYENKHLGGYTKIYPLPESEVQKTQYYEKLIEGAEKMHYSENTPIRIKLEQAEKKKQADQDTKKLKEIQNSRFKQVSNGQKGLPNSSKVLNVQTSNQSQKQGIKTAANISVKKTYSVRQSSSQNLAKDRMGQSQREYQQNQFSVFDSQENKVRRSNTQSNDSDSINQNSLNKSDYININLSASNKQIIADSDNNISHSTSITKNQRQKDEISSLQKNYSFKPQISQKNSIRLNQTLKGHLKVLTSIEKELMKKQSDEIKQSIVKPQASTQKYIFQSKEKLQSYNEIPSSCKEIFAELFNKQKLLPSTEKKKQTEFPQIYDQNIEIISEQQKKSESFKVRMSQKYQKTTNLKVEDLKFVLETKNKRKNIISTKQKLNDTPQMVRLMVRKVNFSHSKGNYSNFPISNIIPTAIGPGGFVIPKMYHLNVESEKRIEASQNILAMISRKNVNKNVFPA